jgi:hypothetical protein
LTVLREAKETMAWSRVAMFCSWDEGIWFVGLVLLRASVNWESTSGNLMKNAWTKNDKKL